MKQVPGRLGEYLVYGLVKSGDVVLALDHEFNVYELDLDKLETNQLDNKEWPCIINDNIVLTGGYKNTGEKWDIVRWKEEVKKSTACVRYDEEIATRVATICAFYNIESKDDIAFLYDNARKMEDVKLLQAVGIWEV